MRSNIGDRAQISSQFSLKPPVPVRRIEQPVLQETAMHQPRFPDRSAGQAGASFLAKRIVTQVVAHSALAFMFARQID